MVRLLALLIALAVGPLPGSAVDQVGKAVENHPHSHHFRHQKRHVRHSVGGHRRTSDGGAKSEDRVLEWREQLHEQEAREKESEVRRAQERRQEELSRAQDDAPWMKKPQHHRRHGLRRPVTDELPPQQAGAEELTIPTTDYQLMRELETIAGEGSDAAPAKTQPVHHHLMRARVEGTRRIRHQRRAVRRGQKPRGVAVRVPRKKVDARMMDPEYRWRDFVRRSRKGLHIRKRHPGSTRVPAAAAVGPDPRSSSGVQHADQDAQAADVLVRQAADDHQEDQEALVKGAATAAAALESKLPPPTAAKRAPAVRKPRHPFKQRHHRKTRVPRAAKPMLVPRPAASPEEDTLRAFHRAGRSRLRAKADTAKERAKVLGLPEPQETEVPPEAVEEEEIAAQELTDGQAGSAAVSTAAGEPTQKHPQESSAAASYPESSFGPVVPLEDVPVQIGAPITPGRPRGPQVKAWADADRAEFKAQEDARRLKEQEVEVAEEKLGHWVADRAEDRLAHPDYIPEERATPTPASTESSEAASPDVPVDEAAQQLGEQLEGAEQEATRHHFEPEQPTGRAPERKWGIQGELPKTVAMRAADEDKRLQRLKDVEQAQFDAEQAEELTRQAEEAKSQSSEELADQEEMDAAEEVTKKAEQAKRFFDEAQERQRKEQEEQAKRQVEEARAEVEHVSQTEQSDEDQFADAFGAYARDRTTAAAAMRRQATATNAPKEEAVAPKQEIAATKSARPDKLEQDAVRAERTMEVWRNDDVAQETKEALKQADEAEALAKQDEQNAEKIAKQFGASAEQAAEQLASSSVEPAAPKAAATPQAATSAGVASASDEAMNEEERDYEVQERAAEMHDAATSTKPDATTSQEDETAREVQAARGVVEAAKKEEAAAAALAPVDPNVPAAQDGFAHALSAGAAVDAAVAQDPGVTDSAKPDEKAFERMTFDISKGFREQGVVGKVVKHEDKKSVTSDWALEYGPSGPPTIESICAKQPNNPWCRRHGFLRPRYQELPPQLMHTAYEPFDPEEDPVQPLRMNIR